MTYTHFVTKVRHPLPAGTDPDLAAVKLARDIQKDLLVAFTDAGQPGEAWRHHVDTLLTHLHYPQDVAGAPNAAAIGLDTGHVLLLPSFLRCLTHLKEDGRQFSICFRTFGADLPKLQPEFNAFCEGKHPYFPGGLVFDGSDGLADHRLRFDGPDDCGTWVRKGTGPAALVLGTLDQPGYTGEIEDHLAYYAGRRSASGLPLRVIEPSGVATCLKGSLGQPRTLALRDRFHAWQHSR